MSQPAVAALAPLPFELVYDDGDRLDSIWHRIRLFDRDGRMIPSKEEIAEAERKRADQAEARAAAAEAELARLRARSDENDL
jgi:hypothetical protein